ncbi:MAG: hypothetical protein BWY78_00876 [Alphaproteobacteria bacterium ADurb.Bin438]|nr:MAG: hypothetical protein BWY78_00876 [Alphaproteobacteria bacterium ADurb.Bin438]
MRKYFKYILSSFFIMGLSFNAHAGDECSDLLALTYQQKFECALKKTTEGSPLLIMDMRNYNAFEDLKEETNSLNETVIAKFDAYKNYERTYQVEKEASYVNLTTPIPVDSDTSSDSSFIPQLVYNNGVNIDDDAIANIKLQGIMQNDYLLASSNTTGSDAILSSMDFSYSKVMEDFFRGVGKTDVKTTSLEFINKFLKEPCSNISAKELFKMRRLMLYRETIKEVAGLGYYAQAQSLDWDEILKDFQSDLDTYTKEGDVNKITRLNFLLRQFVNRLFAMYAQTKAAQAELRAVERMYSDDVILTRDTMKTAKIIAQEGQ